MATYTDINNLFAINPFSGDLVLSADSAAIENSIFNLVLGRRFERPFLEYLNCGVEQELFEILNSVSADNIRNRIQNVLTTYEPRIQNVRVAVNVNRTEDGYDVTIYYLPKNSLQNRQVSLFLAREI